MKEQWQAQMARIDNLSLRERIFLFLSILLCCGALVDTLWLSPAQLAHKQLLVRLDKQGAELQRLRDNLKVSAVPVGVGDGLHDELARIAAQTDQINQRVRGLLPDAANATPLTQALVQLLRRHEGLTLVRTNALPPEIAGQGKDSGLGSLPAGLTRQGVDMTVAGPYAGLMRYVGSLEAALPQIRWGHMTLNMDHAQPELSLQLYLLAEVE